MRMHFFSHSRSLLRCLIMSIVFSIVLGIPTFAKNNINASSEDINPPKVINVVYDDSGSMLSGDRWYNAAYALEVFTAMMGENDILNFYPMARYDANNENRKRDYTTDYITIKGSDGKRVDKIGDIKPCFTGGDTPIECVEAAEAGLQNGNYAGYEQWLVVLTDGDTFYRGKDTISDTVDALSTLLNNSAKKNNVYYLAIGDAAGTSATELEKKLEEKGKVDSLLIRNAKNDEILSKVTEAANTIFGYQELPNNSGVVSESAGNYELSIDVPVSQLIIFAQGENVSVGNLTVNGDKVNGESPLVVECEGLPVDSKTGEKVDEYKVSGDNRHTGVVATFNSGDTPISSGEFNVRITGAKRENVVFYYKVGAIPVCKFVDGDGNEAKDSGEGIEPGEYSVVFGFVDPLSGEIIQSNLLKTAGEPKIKITNNGKELDASSGKVNIGEGNVEYTIEVTFEDGQKINNSDIFDVKPELLSLSIRIDAPTEPYKAQELGENATPVKVTIIDNKTGEPVTKEQADALDLKISFGRNENNLAWGKVIKKPEASTFEVKPSARNNNVVKNIISGTYYFDVRISGKIINQTIDVPAQGSIQVVEYTGTKLDVVVEDVDTSVFALRHHEFAGIPVKVYVTDEKSGKDVPLTREEWDCLKPKFREASSGIWWNCEKGKEIGSYIVRPVAPFNLVLFMRGAVNARAIIPPKQSEEKLREYASPVDARLEFTGKLGPLAYSGSERVSASIIPLSGWDIWRKIWKYLAIFVVSIIVLIGEINKKRINRKHFHPAVSYEGLLFPCDYRITRRFIPYFPERADVSVYIVNICELSGLHIEAYKKNSFIILNIDDLVDGPMELDGATVSRADIEDVRGSSYSYRAFTMRPHSKKRGIRVGQFHMDSE